MTDPSLALDKAVLDVLRADPTLRGLCGDRIYDVVPAGATFPYVSLGPGQIVPTPADGLERSVEVFVTVDAWSQKPGRPQIKTFCAAITDALLEAEPDLGADLTLVLFADGGTRHLLDADGITHHGVLTFRALVDQA